MKWLSNFLNGFQWNKNSGLSKSLVSVQGWEQEHALAKVNILQQGIEDALIFLKKFKKKHGKKLPWILCLGTEKIGKTSLLAMSGLDMVSVDHEPCQQINSTAYCDWWFTEEAVLIDIAGSLVLDENPASQAHFVWDKFIEGLHQHRKSDSLRSLALCLDLNDFRHKTRIQKQLQVDMLRHRIQTLTRYVQQIPIYLIFTKCDQITGFVDSFNSLSPEDCMQPLGISLSYGIHQQSFAQKLEQQFNQFLMRLNEQLMGRLHREHSLEKRSNIKSFPLQLENLKRDIIYLATQLHSVRTSLTGIYFSSSLQDGKNANALNHLANNFGLSSLGNIESLEYPPQKKAFFIQQPLKKMIHHRFVVERKLPDFLTRQGKKFYVLLAGLCLITGFFMIPSYFYNQKTLKDVQTALANYQAAPIHDSLSDKSLASMLVQLNQLGYALHEAKTHGYFAATRVFNEAHQLERRLNDRYQDLLHQQFTPYVQTILESQLQSDPQKNPQQLFVALKLYLMLTNASQLNPSLVMEWFKDYWEKTLPKHPDVQKQLLYHLSAWLNQPSILLTANESTIKEARQALSNLPLAELAYLVLQERYHENEQKNNTPKIQQAYFVLPLASMYSAAHFNEIYQVVIPELAQQVATGHDSVLNLQLPSSLKETLVSSLTDNVRKLYVQRYAAYWQLQLLNMGIGQFKNLSQAQEFALNFSSEASPLFALLHIVIHHLKPIANFESGQETLANAQQLQALLQSAHQNPELKKAFDQVSLYFSSMLQQEDPNKAILKATQKRMTQGANDPIGQLKMLAETLPDPLKQWVNAYAQSSWRMLLTMSQNYMNLLWLAEVLPAYNEKIKHRYPVFPDAQKEMDLQAFSEFFGHEGSMNHFFEEYLSPFVDNSQLYWKWKYQDNERLPISQDTLDMFARASLIRQMYFADRKKMPYVQFNLTPMAVELLSQNYILNLGGQTIDYSSDFRQQKRIVWKGSYGSKDPNINQASLLWTQGAKTKILFEEKGEWAVFKLLAKGRLQSMGNSQAYELTFSDRDRGVTVPYELLASEVINPFIPGIVSTFRCPEKL